MAPFSVITLNDP